MTLSRSRDRQLLATLRKQALTPLVEMARWKSEGHALAAFIILGRIASTQTKPHAPSRIAATAKSSSKTRSTGNERRHTTRGGVTRLAP